MQRHQLFESLLSSSANVIQDRREHTKEGEQDIRRLKRKIIKELPEQKIKKSQQTVKPILCPTVFNPQSRFIIAWQMLNIFLIYIYFIEIPIVIAFENHRVDNEIFFKTLNFPVVMVFIIDIFINLNTSFYQDGLLQSDPIEIRMNYLKNNLLFDLIGIGTILFYEIIQIFDISKDFFKLVVLIFYIRMKQLFRIQRIVVNAFDLNRRIKAMVKLALLLMKILLICNIVACGAFLLSYYLSDNQLIKNKDLTPCGPECYWILDTQQADIPLKQCAFSVQYIYSLYWASTTMISIGYGDITPKNLYEVIFTVIIQFLSCLLYGYAINEIWSIIQQLNSKKSKIHSRLNIINLYMRDKEIGPLLNAKINGYLNNYYYAKNLRQRQIEAQIIGQLTPSLKRQLYYQSYSILLQHKFFISMSEKVVVSACQNVKEVCCYEDEPLSPREISPSPCLYFLKKGELMQRTAGASCIRLRTQYNGDYIGLYQFISQLSYLSDLTAIKYTLAYYLKYQYWRTALQEDVGCFEYFYLTKESLLLYNEFGRIGHSCFFCSLQDHRSELCFDTKLRKIIKIEYQISNRNENHQRRGYARRKFMIHIAEKRSRKKSFSRAPDFQFPKRIQHYHHASLLTVANKVDEMQQIGRKESIEQMIQIRRGGRVVTKHRHKIQNQRALDKVRINWESREEQTSQYTLMTEEIRSLEVDIDVLAQYEEYYPKYNSSEFNLKEQLRRRITRSFYI